MSSMVSESLPDVRGHFGPYGGRFVPETLMHPLQELEAEYLRARQDPEFQRELAYYLKEFCGRPTPLYYAERLSRELGGGGCILSARTSFTPEPTRSTTASGRCSWRGGWAKRA
jgi:tryptophan synthase beta subunit